MPPLESVPFWPARTSFIASRIEPMDGTRRPAASRSPSTVVRSTSASARTSFTMSEESQSLSPNVRPLSSSSATTSFSFTTGTMPARTRWSSERRTLAARRRSSKSACVSSTWPIFTPAAPKRFSYSEMKRAWPTAAHICTSLTCVGRDFSPSASTPAATAPEETKMTSRPALRSSQSWPTRRRSAR